MGVSTNHPKENFLWVGADETGHKINLNVTERKVVVRVVAAIINPG